MLDQVRRTSRQEHHYPVRGHASFIVHSKSNVSQARGVQMDISVQGGGENYVRLKTFFAGAYSS